jgi:branched-chain amino acid transport system ATP-binding protein
MEDLTVNFGGLIAVKNVSMEVKKRGITGIIGPNGAGKTTLFNAITGFVKVASGEIKFERVNISGLKPHEIAGKGIIRTFQNGGIFPEMSVLENIMTGYDRLARVGAIKIALGLRLAKREEIEVRNKALEILRRLKIVDLIDYRTGDLSFGQQRLVEIGRALIADPKLLLLDEPGAGLSSAERGDLVTLLKGISEQQGIYILLTDHSMDFVMEICDYITVLNYGEKIGEGTPKEIQENAKVIEAYLGKSEE